jgi:hypothetical protein
MQKEALDKQIITWMLPGLSPWWIEDGGDDTVAVFLPEPWRESLISPFSGLPLMSDFSRKINTTRRFSGATPLAPGWSLMGEQSRGRRARVSKLSGIKRGNGVLGFFYGGVKVL